MELEPLLGLVGVDLWCSHSKHSIPRVPGSPTAPIPMASSPPRDQTHHDSSSAPVLTLWAQQESIVLGGEAIWMPPVGAELWSGSGQQVPS